MQRSTSVQNLIFYGLSVPIAALNLWLLSVLYRFFQHPFTIICVAAILAFLLNYPVNFFERIRIVRTQAVALVLLVTLTVFVILGITLVPVLIDQTTQLVAKVPDWLTTSQANLQSVEAWARRLRLPLDFSVIRRQINATIENNANTQNILQQLATGAVGFAGTLLSVIFDFLLVVVLAFYMLIYGDRVWLGMINLLPVKYRAAFNNSLRLNFHYFFLSQFLLALFMTAALIPIFIILKVQFALLFTIIIGISQLIPIFGATLGIGLVTMVLLLQNWWLAVQVACVTIIVQQIKDNLIAPKLLGEFIGLNPIWIFVAILMGFEIAGLLGTLVAIPVAGTIKGTYDAITADNLEDKNSISIAGE
jgi:predicted PurR-regulated permease PerM